MALQLLSQICMSLCAEALEILAYLKTDSGRFVSLAEISRRAGGRRRFEESPSWAKRLLPPLVEAGLVEMNARGHYRSFGIARTPGPAQSPPTPPKLHSKIVGDDYFPTPALQRIVGGDYFPEND